MLRWKWYQQLILDLCGKIGKVLKSIWKPRRIQRKEFSWAFSKVKKIYFCFMNFRYIWSAGNTSILFLFLISDSLYIFCQFLRDDVWHFTAQKIGFVFSFVAEGFCTEVYSSKSQSMPSTFTQNKTQSKNEQMKQLSFIIICLDTYAGH